MRFLSSSLLYYGFAVWRGNEKDIGKIWLNILQENYDIFFYKNYFNHNSKNKWAFGLVERLPTTFFFFFFFFVGKPQLTYLWFG